MGELVLGSVPPRQEMGATPRIYAQLWPGMGKSSVNIQFRHIKCAQKKSGKLQQFIYLNGNNRGRRLILVVISPTFTNSHILAVMPFSILPIEDLETT